MSESKIETVADVYRFVERLSSECQANGANVLFTQLDDALHLGSSGLEILGAIRHIVINNRLAIEQLLGADGKDRADQIVNFVERVYGRVE
jgi:hypothetical protein